MTILLICITLLVGCNAEITDDPRIFRVLSYNVQNLFDSTLDGDEYPEYQDPKRYNDLSYRRRLSTLAKTITDAQLGYPDVLVLQEVEGPRVVEDLLRYHLGRHGWAWYVTASEPEGAISVAVISRHPLQNPVIHSWEGGGRPALEVTVETSGEQIVLFALHAKSQIGIFEETEEQRVALIETVGEAARCKEGENILICGDFNENPTAVWESGGVRTALVDSSHPEARRYVEQGSLGLVGEARQVCAPWFYSPYLDEHPPKRGSCNWDGTWQQYDQILASSRLFDAMGWEYASFEVCELDYLLTGDGRPKAWNLALLSGYSDHLPVMMTLRRR